MAMAGFGHQKNVSFWRNAKGTPRTISMENRRRSVSSSTVPSAHRGQHDRIDFRLENAGDTCPNGRAAQDFRGIGSSGREATIDRVHGAGNPARLRASEIKRKARHCVIRLPEVNVVIANAGVSRLLSDTGDRPSS